MEYIQDGDLGQDLKQSGCYSSYNTSEFTWQLLEGLEALHQMNICHRDLKPPVCSLCSAAQITTRAYNLAEHPHCLASALKIADFGILKRTEATELRTQVGFQGYTVPEFLGLLPRAVVTATTYSNAVDMWALALAKTSAGEFRPADPIPCQA